MSCDNCQDCRDFAKRTELALVELEYARTRLEIGGAATYIEIERSADNVDEAIAYLRGVLVVTPTASASVDQESPAKGSRAEPDGAKAASGEVVGDGGSPSTSHVPARGPETGVSSPAAKVAKGLYDHFRGTGRLAGQRASEAVPTCRYCGDSIPKGGKSCRDSMGDDACEAGPCGETFTLPKDPRSNEAPKPRGNSVAALAPEVQDDQKWAQEIVAELMSNDPPWDAPPLRQTRGEWMYRVLRNCREDERNRQRPTEASPEPLNGYSLGWRIVLPADGGINPLVECPSCEEQLSIESISEGDDHCFYDCPNCGDSAAAGPGPQRTTEAAPWSITGVPPADVLRGMLEKYHPCTDYACSHPSEAQKWFELRREIAVRWCSACGALNRDGQTWVTPQRAETPVPEDLANQRWQAQQEAKEVYEAVRDGRAAHIAEKRCTCAHRFGHFSHCAMVTGGTDHG